MRLHKLWKQDVYSASCVNMCEQTLLCREVCAFKLHLNLYLHFKTFFSTLNLLRMWEISACLCDISITSFSWTHTLRVVILVKWLQERFSLCKEKRQLSHIHAQTISLFFLLLLSIIYWHGSGCRFPWKFLSVAVAKWSCDCVSRPAAARVLNDFISL